MKEIEEQFRKELARISAPPGFAERVAANVHRKRGVLTIPNWLAIAAALILMASISLGLYEHRRATQAVQAKEQLLRALEITASTLERTKSKVLKRTRGDI